MSTQTAQRATTAALLMASVAMVLMAGSVIVDNQYAGRVGLIALLSVPMVRNVVVVVVGQGRERGLAVLGIALVVMVMAMTLRGP